MTLAEQLKNTLLDELRGGKTQTQLAKEHNVSQQYISTLLSAEHDCEGVSLGIVSKMFPLSSLNLNGNITTSQHGTNNVVVNGENSGTVNNGSPAPSEAQIRLAVDAFRHEVVDALIGLDIPPDALAAVLKTIKELAPKGTAQ